jgi:hypothetical protein
MKQAISDIFIVPGEQAQFATVELALLSLETAFLIARKRVFGGVLVSLLQLMLITQEGIDFAVELLVVTPSCAYGIDVGENLFGIMNALGGDLFSRLHVFHAQEEASQDEG